MNSFARWRKPGILSGLPPTVWLRGTVLLFLHASLFRDFRSKLRDYCAGRSQWPRGRRRVSASDRLRGLRVRIPPGRGCLSLVSVVCCQVEVCVTSRSFVQRSPTECDQVQLWPSTHTMGRRRGQTNKERKKEIVTIWIITVIENVKADSAGAMLYLLSLFLTLVIILNKFVDVVYNLESNYSLPLFFNLSAFFWL